MLVIEQLGFGRVLKKAFRPLQHLYLLFFLLLSWVIFRSPSIQDAMLYIGAMFGAGGRPEDFSLAAEYLNNRTLFALMIGILGSTRFFEIGRISITSVFVNRIYFIRVVGTHLYSISIILFVLIIMVVSTIFITAGTSNPFIYFKF